MGREKGVISACFNPDSVLFTMAYYRSESVVDKRISGYQKGAVSSNQVLLGFDNNDDTRKC